MFLPMCDYGPEEIENSMVKWAEEVDKPVFLKERLSLEP